jgi:hypothetical protein
MTVNELIEYLNSNPDFKATLPDTISDTDMRNYGRRLGIALSKRKDMKFPNDLSLITDGEFRRALKWKVVRGLKTKTHTNLATNVSLESLVQPTRVSTNEDTSNLLYREGLLQDSQNSQSASTGESLETKDSHSIFQEDGISCKNSKGLFPDDLLQFWISRGRPIIHLGDGENCEDLERLISGVVNERQNLAIKLWYEEKKRRDK